MKNAILGIIIVSLACISCENSDPPAKVVEVKFMSSTAGSTWNYELTDNILSSTSLFKITSTNKDSSINGRIYHVFSNSSSANEYYNITGNDYFNFRSLPAAFGGSNVENIYLKDNAAAGFSWNQSYPVTVSGISVNVSITHTITAKGISKTIKGVIYNDVTHVTTAVAVTYLGIPLPSSALTTDIQAFYAPKFGMIHSINKIDLNFNNIVSNTFQQTNLVSADIK